jgi:hypothetical protein
MSNAKGRRRHLLGDERKSVCDLTTPDIADGYAPVCEGLY